MREEVKGLKKKGVSLASSQAGLGFGISQPVQLS